jgi:hypothetical protein
MNQAAQPVQEPYMHSQWQETIAGIPVTFESEAEAKRFLATLKANTFLSDKEMTQKFLGDVNANLLDEVNRGSQREARLIPDTVSVYTELESIQHCTVAQMHNRAVLAERQLRDVTMAASIKLAAARMVLSQMKGNHVELELAIEGVLATFPAPNKLLAENRKELGNG